jgi:hypothetical protein
VRDEKEEEGSDEEGALRSGDGEGRHLMPSKRKKKKKRIESVARKKSFV